MANYAVQKAKYGGMVGSIQAFTNQLPAGNDPNAGAFRSQLPAGFLRCDGSILRERDYPALAAVLGVGDVSKFAKDPASMNSDEFQLPDIGSKYIVPANSSGTYLSTFLSDGITRRVGAEFDIRSNVGTSETITYGGNFRVIGRTDDLIGNPLFSGPEETPRSVITDSAFQAHGHLANQAVLNCTGNYEVSPGIGPEDSSRSHSGNNCHPYGGNLLYSLATPEGATATSASHDHRITVPTSAADYSHNMEYTFVTQDIAPNNLRTTVNISTSTVTTFDTTIAPFIVVEYIIKF
jgi:hypothetical protein